jgi:prophage DNA circulation protein
VEQGSFLSGRRIALHEYPKRDLPYAEDMGRRSRRFALTAYLIGPNYHQARDQLKNVLESEGSGALTVYQGSSPTWTQNVVVEEFSVIEVRERGGYCLFEMRFTEVGTPTTFTTSTQTQATVGATAAASDTAASNSFVNTTVR